MKLAHVLLAGAGVLGAVYLATRWRGAAAPEAGVEPAAADVPGPEPSGAILEPAHSVIAQERPPAVDLYAAGQQILDLLARREGRPLMPEIVTPTWEAVEADLLRMGLLSPAGAVATHDARTPADAVAVF